MAISEVPSSPRKKSPKRTEDEGVDRRRPSRRSKSRPRRNDDDDRRKLDSSSSRRSKSINHRRKSDQARKPRLSEEEDRRQRRLSKESAEDTSSHRTGSGNQLLSSSSHHSSNNNNKISSQKRERRLKELANELDTSTRRRSNNKSRDLLGSSSHNKQRSSARRHVLDDSSSSSTSSTHSNSDGEDEPARRKSEPVTRRSRLRPASPTKRRMTFNGGNNNNNSNTRKAAAGKPRKSRSRRHLQQQQDDNDNDVASSGSELEDDRRRKSTMPRRLSRKSLAVSPKRRSVGTSSPKRKSLGTSPLRGNSDHQNTKSRAPRSIAAGCIKIQIMQARGLVAMDRDLIGRKTSSDPYVTVLWNEGGDWTPTFQTKTHMKTLTPQFNETFTLELGAHAMNDLLLSNHRFMPNLELRMWDYNPNAPSDYMGGCVVSAGKNLSQSEAETAWYKLQSQSFIDPKLTCSYTQGELQFKVWMEARWLPELDRGSLLPLPNNDGTQLSLELFAKTPRDDTMQVDISAVAVDRKGQIVLDECVYFANPSTEAFAIQGGRTLQMQLDRLPQQVIAVYYVIHSPSPDSSLDDLAHLQVRLLDGDVGLCRYVCPNSNKEPTAQIVLRLARDGRTNWQLVPIGKSFCHSRDFGTLLPHIKSLTRDLVKLKIDPLERLALLRPGSATRLLDYCTADDFPDVLKWNVRWSTGQARATAFLLNRQYEVVAAVSSQKPSSVGVRHSKIRQGSEAFSIGVFQVPSRVEYICITLCPEAKRSQPARREASLSLSSFEFSSNHSLMGGSDHTGRDDSIRSGTDSVRSSTETSWLRSTKMAIMGSKASLPSVNDRMPSEFSSDYSLRSESLRADSIRADSLRSDSVRSEQVILGRDDVGKGSMDMSWLRSTKMAIMGSKASLPSIADDRMSSGMSTPSSGGDSGDLDGEPLPDAVSDISCQLHDPVHKVLMGTAPVPQAVRDDKPLLLACFCRDGDLWNVRMVAQPSATTDARQGWQTHLQETPEARPNVLVEAPDASSFAKISMPEQTPYTYPIHFLVTEESLEKHT